MTLERDFLRKCYVVRIPREEMMRMFIRAEDNANRYGCSVDELVAKEFSEKILCLINSSERKGDAG